ncbi:MAG: LptE family protein [Candidatus Krumholzibacteriia bacterium]
MKRWALGLACLFASLGTAAGCGVYSASSGRVDDSLKRISVQYFENRTAEPNLGVDLADAVILSLQTDNTLKVVDEASSDTILSGEVTRYARREQFARQDLTVNEYQVQIAVSLTLARRATGETIFKDRRFTGTGNYLLDGSNGTSEQTARSQAATEIVKDILAQVVEDW